MIEKNTAEVLKRIREASQQSRFGGTAELAAVTKNRDTESMERLLSCGVDIFAENRVQEMLKKYEYFKDRVDWHMIGTLQKNKVRHIIDKVSLIQSADSEGLLEHIDICSKKISRTTDVLLQVNTAKEPQKHGFFEEDMDDVLRFASSLENVRVKGIMMIAPDCDNEDILCSIFDKTRKIFEISIEKTLKYDNIDFRILSMGMTNDYETAVKCGANMVRVGRALFE